MKIINKVMAICAIIMLTILGLSIHYAEAIQHCIDKGGGIIQ